MHQRQCRFNSCVPLARKPFSIISCYQYLAPKGASLLNLFPCGKFRLDVWSDFNILMRLTWLHPKGDRFYKQGKKIPYLLLQSIKHIPGQ
jgi:hypothetical protein